MQKKILLVAGAVVTLGLILCFASFASVGFSVSGFAAQEDAYVEKTYTASVNDVQKVWVDASNMPITVVPVKGNEIAVTYFTSEKDPYEAAFENGVLSVKRKNMGWFQSSNFSLFGSLHMANLHIQIDVPEAYAGDFQLVTSNGRISVTDLANITDVTVNTSNASVQMENLAAEQISIDTSNGAVSLTRINVLKQTRVDTSNGAIAAKQVISRDGIYLHTSNGSIGVEEVEAPVIELRSSNARIMGTVSGLREDYSVSASTSNGDNNLQSGGTGDKRLTVDTSNGSIQIGFNGK